MPATRTARKRPAKRGTAKPVRPAKRTPLAKKSTPTVRKSAAKRTPAKKSAATARKVAGTKRAAPVTTKEFDEHGFLVGSDSSVMAAELVKGGESRLELNDRLATMFKGQKTRYGAEKNVASLVSGVITKLVARGYSIESSYRIVPPARSTTGRQKIAKRKTR
jgi:hypothetical protein